MKKLITAAITIAACAALCAPVWPQTGAGEKVPTAEVKMRTTPICAEVLAEQEQSAMSIISPEMPANPQAEKEDAAVNKTGTIPEPTKASEQGAQPIAAEVNVLVPMSTAPATSPSDADPYHTDVYPENVYSEELIYDADGNLIGKTITIPTEFGSDVIWIDGRAYYDLPGFGLIEWSGPGQRTEAYTMYESGVKVGIMGGEDKAPANHPASASQPDDWPEPTGEVIDQTINTVPERSCIFRQHLNTESGGFEHQNGNT